ncbi:MAG: pyridoxal phosphate-dependent aminotransferase [Oscillospiraceae bacterium]|nr:pyridoxal phosphate-dependent aminotransferase [Oscillospiraceae bacterium]
MKSISKVAAGIAPSATLAITATANEMKARGIDVIGFGAGEPDFPTPESIKAAGIKAIQDNQSRYTPSAGVMPLRKAISAYMERTFGLSYAPNQICVTSGAKHVIYITLQVLLDPGDEVILPAPYWVTYAEAIRMAGGVPVIVETTEENRFKMTPEQLRNAITDKTKCLIMTNPSNPTGMLYSPDEVRALSEIICEKDLYVLDDEIYACLIYNGEFLSFASVSDEMKERTIIINGVSKTYAMTGWRIGFAAGNTEIMKAMSNYLSHSTGNASNAAQFASIEAYSGEQYTAEKMRQEFDRRRKYFVSRVNAMELVSCLEPDGAFYVFMNVKKTFGMTLCGEQINSSADFCAALLKHGLVATVPGNAFGADGYVRWSYATSMENIRNGLDRLEKFLQS